MTRLPEEPDYAPLPPYRVEEAPRLALEIQDALRDDVAHPAIKVLRVDTDELMAALELDQGRSDGNFPNTILLLEQRIRQNIAASRDPLLIEQRREQAGRLRAQEQARLDAARNAKILRIGAPLATAAALALGGAVAAFNVTRPEILRVLAQNELNGVAVDLHTARELATTTPSAVGLKGVPVRFPCIKNKDADGNFYWKPGDVRDVYSDDDLASDAYRYQVQFEKGVDPDVSVAEAGWGTTVQFLPTQVEANYPAAYAAVPLDANGSPVYMIPTGKFVADPENVLPAEFTTGEHAKDGSLVHYNLVTPEGPACTGAAEEGDTKVKMVDAILDTEYPELTIANLAGSTPEVDGAYTVKFEEYGLGEWYSRTFYPNLVASMDIAIRDASKTGVARADLQKMSDFLAQRKFEQDLLRLLQYLKANVKKDTFEMFVDQLKASNAPHFAVNVDEAKETSATHGHAERTDGARQGYVYLFPSDINENVLFDALIRSISTSEPVPGLFDSVFGDPMAYRAEDQVFDAGIGYFLTEHAVEGGVEVSDTPSRLLIDQLAEKGMTDDVIRYWTFNPDDKLSANEAALYLELGLSTPVAPRYVDMMDAVMEASVLDKTPAEVTEAERTSFTAFVTANQQIATGQLGLETGAQSMLTALTDLTQ
jgi:hypothetical protein